MLQSKDILNVLRNDSAKSFIRQHISDHITELGLKHSGKTTFNLTVCLQLLHVYQRAKQKMPLVVDHLLAIDQRSYEQATAQRVTAYKAQFIQGKALLDMTAGWGMDAIVLSQHFERVVAVEHNPDVHAMAQYNVEVLGLNRIERICGKGEDYVSKDYDWIYIDPDRRVGAKRGVKIADMEPNLNLLYPLWEKLKSKVYIKLSPLFDVDEAVRAFPHTETLHVIAERGEVKELGVVLNFEHTQPVNVVIHDVHSQFSYRAAIEDTKASLPPAQGNENYIHLAHAGLLKARLAEAYLQPFGMKRHAHFSLFFSAEEVSVPGMRSLTVIDRLSWKAKDIVKSLKNNNIEQVNIVLKGSKEAAAIWHKKLKTSDGGVYYLFLLKHAEREAILARITS